ncbi:hypothetical protein [Paludibaculum fermentans]|uniref:hypothetical protein n=1 Tax=Paludibaculum fermentans TaxID=1473598 RepID=UPI003EC00412
MKLHITNGDSVVGTLQDSFPGDTILPWRDVLHDGPVPAGRPLSEFSAVRAHFLAAESGLPYAQVLSEFQERDGLLARYAEFDETVLWFEHDLYDQLQLIQILDWFATQAADAPNLRLIQADDYLGRMEPAHFTELYPARQAVSAAQLSLASAAWLAVRSADPAELEPLLVPNTELPFLAAALTRLCEEYPWTTDGLSRTQRTIRELKNQGITDRADLFTAFTRQEEAIWMGDWSFFRVLDGEPPRGTGWQWNATLRRFESHPS